MLPSITQGHLPQACGVSLFYKRVSFATLSKPELFFLSGYRADTTGTKACFLWDFAHRTQTNCTLFDYAGCGKSSGAFDDATIGQWKENALSVFDQITQGPQILIGSSMGAWIMMLVMRERPERTARLIGIGSAPDFTQDLFFNKLSPQGKEDLATQGKAVLLRKKSTLELTRLKVEEGRNHLIFASPLKAPCPMFLLHGLADDVVPWQHSQKLCDHLEAPFSSLTLIKEGDHSLSRPQDLDLLGRLCGAV